MKIQRRFHFCTRRIESFQRCFDFRSNGLDCRMDWYDVCSRQPLVKDQAIAIVSRCGLKHFVSCTEYIPIGKSSVLPPVTPLLRLQEPPPSGPIPTKPLPVSSVHSTMTTWHSWDSLDSIHACPYPSSCIWKPSVTTFYSVLL